MDRVNRRYKLSKEQRSLNAVQRFRELIEFPSGLLQYLFSFEQPVVG